MYFLEGLEMIELDRNHLELAIQPCATFSLVYWAGADILHRKVQLFLYPLCQIPELEFLAASSTNLTAPFRCFTCCRYCIQWTCHTWSQLEKSSKLLKIQHRDLAWYNPVLNRFDWYCPSNLSTSVPPEGLDLSPNVWEDCPHWTPYRLEKGLKFQLWKLYLIGMQSR